MNRGRVATLFRTLAAIGVATLVALASASSAVELPASLRGHFVGWDSLVLSDGRTLVGGAYTDDPQYLVGVYSFALTRLNADGSLDTSFGAAGLATVDIWGYYEYINAIAVQPDGRVVVGGNAADPKRRGPDCRDPDFCGHYPALARFNPDGSLDRTFNRTGSIVLAIGDAAVGREVGRYGTLTDIAVGPDGKIVVYSAGTAVARLEADGTLDTTFAGTPQIARELAFTQVQGLWWAAPAGSESGWGMSLAHEDNVVFAVWFTYDAAGKPWWLTMTGFEESWDTFAGTLYETRGPAFDAPSFDPARVTRRAVGTGRLVFTDSDNGSFAYTIDGVTYWKAITRQQFGPTVTCRFGWPPAAQATNYEDLWWAAPPGSESGWGVGLAHQGDTIFATWFTYGADAAPLWLSGAATKVAEGRYEGTLYRTQGPAFDAPFVPSKVVRDAVGTLALAFDDGNFGRFEYTVDGVTRSKQITRQIFRWPGTVCR